MHYRTLGQTGIKVSHLCLGTMMLGSWGNPDHDEGERIINAALDHGVNFVDTADVYSGGESEEIVGRALKGRRDHVVLATKFHARMGDDRNAGGNSRRWVTRAVEDSLRRLDTEWIDLYQVHRPDPSCDIDETLGALSDLVHAGKVRAIGSSTFPAEEIVEARWVAERRNRERFACEQPPYSIFVREVEASVLPTCQRHGMGVVAWAPLNGGWLTGKYRLGQEPPEGSRATRGRLPDRYDPEHPHNRDKYEALEGLAKVASDAGCSLTHLAMTWVVQHPAVTSAIIGPRTMEQLKDLMGGQDIVLDDAALDRIDEIVPPGTTINPADNGYTPPAVRMPSLRRRAPGAREAAVDW